ncbi:hypothetical protein GCM10027037_15460 [Mucilaginibacter koreensis]
MEQDTVHLKIIKHELAAVGINITDIYDLVNTNTTYKKGIPILINALSYQIKQDTLLEGVIRALATKDARGTAGKALLKCFSSISPEKVLLKWAVGNSMTKVITENEVEEVISIVNNKKLGIERQMFVLSLAEVPSPKVEEILIKLLDDEIVILHALQALAKIKSTQSLERIKLLTQHSNIYIRRQAVKSIKSIQKK